MAVLEHVENMNGLDPRDGSLTLGNLGAIKNMDESEQPREAESCDAPRLKMFKIYSIINVINKWLIGTYKQHVVVIVT